MSTILHISRMILLTIMVSTMAAGHLFSVSDQMIPCQIECTDLDTEEEANEVEDTDERDLPKMYLSSATHQTGFQLLTLDRHVHYLGKHIPVFTPPPEFSMS